MDLIEAVHVQCHEHLRDADKKRDAIIGFYAVVVGLLFASYEKVDNGLRPLLIIAVAFVGVFVVLAVLQYRKWHTIYSNCLQALERAVWLNPKATKADIQTAWNDLKVPQDFLSTWRLLNPFEGTEAATFDALLVLSFLPWYLIPKVLPNTVVFHVPSDLVGFAIGFVAYLVITSIVGMGILNHANRKGAFSHWVLRPFDV